MKHNTPCIATPNRNHFKAVCSGGLHFTSLHLTSLDRTASHLLQLHVEVSCVLFVLGCLQSMTLSSLEGSMETRGGEESGRGGDKEGR